MSNTVTFTGLDELRQALRTLPDDLANEAGVIVQEHAYTAAQAVRDVYEQHRRSGGLADGVTVATTEAGRFGVGMVVSSAAKDAWLFENGSQARHTSLGADRGSMPATPTFIPTMIDFRRAMWVALAAMVQAQGLIVTGSAESGDVAA